MGFVRGPLARLVVPLAASTLVASGGLPSRATAQDVPLQRVHAMVPPSGANASVSGDWDGDGDLDLAAAGLVWLENVDHGAFEERAVPGSIGHTPLVGADFDEDGRADLISDDGAARTVGIWKNESGPFATSPSPILPAGSNRYTEAEVGDLDGDGDQDLYVYRGSAPDMELFNDGAGAFPVQTVGAPSSFGSLALVLVDSDGDGDLDVLRGDGASVELWKNDGSGSFVPSPTQLPPSGSSPLEAADVDGDGDADYVAGNAPHLFLNRGDDLFTDEGAVSPPLAGAPSPSFHLVDVDGDELPDVVAAPFVFGPAPRNARLYLNNGRSRFEARPELFLPAVITVIADLDGDHDRDLIGTGYGLELWLGDGRGSLVNTRDAWETKTSTLWALPGDLDRDPFLDVFAWGGLSSGWPAIVYHGLPDGTYLEESLPLTLPGRPIGTSLGDVDLDGDLDVYALSYLPMTSPSTSVWIPVLLENDGLSGFVQVSGRFPSTMPTSTSNLQDLDLDGDPDLLAVVYSYSGMYGLTRKFEGFSWLNDGTGTFLDSGKLLPSKTGTSSNLSSGAPFLGDLDGDADPDAVVTGFGLWSNDGSGGFTDVSTLLNGNFLSSDVGLADMDRDGDLDIVTKFANCSDGYCYGFGRVLRNDGSGSFAASPGFWDSFDPFRGFGDLSLVDIDEDGDVDVLTPSCGLWVNDGTGRLEDESYELTHCSIPTSYYAYLFTPYYTGLGVDDLDLDGDPDLWPPGLPRSVANTTRHVSWRSYPRAGKPLTMDVFGPAGTPFQLFSSTGFTEPQATDMGFLRLATRGARLVAAGTLDAEGKAAVTLGVPSDLALPENTVYWQAVVGAPPRLTNLELTRFSNL
jgi:hypothetical protein